MSWKRLSAVCTSALLIVTSGAAWAQGPQITTGTPLGIGNNGFFERMGIGWQIQGNGWFFRKGGFNNAIPQFGGFQPGAGLEGGFGFTGSNGLLGRVNFEFSQGARSSFTSQTPLVTMFNGQTAIFSDTSQSPFVITVRPPLLPAPREGLPWKQQWDGDIPRQPKRDPDQTFPGARPPAPTAKESPLPEASLAREIQASVLGPVESVAEIKRRRKSADEAAQREQQVEVATLIAKAEEALRDCKPALAAVFLRSAARRATGEQAARVQALLQQAAP